MDDMLAAPPAVSGLGNFKGVMLCNRPSDNNTSGGFGDAPGPFISGSSATYGEQLGLNPLKREGPEVVKTRGPSAALRHHVKWLRELQGQMREERGQVDAEDREDALKQQRVKAAAEAHRSGVRAMMAERDDAEGLTQKRAEPKKKPLWALTVKEKAEFEEGEADELLKFADDLDYEKYIDNYEFRQNLDALRDRAGKIQKEQDAFKDALVAEFNDIAADDAERSTSAGGSPRRIEDDLDVKSLGISEGASSTASQRQRRAERLNSDGRPEWETSTSCGDRREADLLTRDAVDYVLDSNPQMKAVHSKGSVARMVQRVKAQAELAEPVGLVEQMNRDGPAAVPVIQVSSDTQNHLNKPVQASQLPYLYRSPAV